MNRAGTCLALLLAAAAPLAALALRAAEPLPAAGPTPSQTGWTGLVRAARDGAPGLLAPLDAGDDRRLREALSRVGSELHAAGIALDLFVLDVEAATTRAPAYGSALAAVRGQCLTPALTPPVVLCDVALLRALDTEVGRFSADAWWRDPLWTALGGGLVRMWLNEQADRTFAAGLEAAVERAARHLGLPTEVEIAAEIERMSGGSAPGGTQTLAERLGSGVRAAVVRHARRELPPVAMRVLMWNGWAALSPESEGRRRERITALGARVAEGYVRAALEAAAAGDRLDLLTGAVRFVVLHEMAHILWPTQAAPGGPCTELSGDAPARRLRSAAQRGERRADLFAFMQAVPMPAGEGVDAGAVPRLMGAVLALRALHGLAGDTAGERPMPVPSDLRDALAALPVTRAAIERRGGLTSAAFPPVHGAPDLRLQHAFTLLAPPMKGEHRLVYRPMFAWHLAKAAWCGVRRGPATEPALERLRWAARAIERLERGGSPAGLLDDLPAPELEVGTLDASPEATDALERFVLTRSVEQALDLASMGEPMAAALPPEELAVLVRQLARAAVQHLRARGVPMETLVAIWPDAEDEEAVGAP